MTYFAKDGNARRVLVDVPDEKTHHVLLFVRHPLDGDLEKVLAAALAACGATVEIRYHGFSFSLERLKRDLDEAATPVTDALFLLERPSYMLHEKEILHALTEQAVGGIGFVCLYTDQSLKEINTTLKQIASKVSLIAVQHYSDHARIRRDWPGITGSCVIENFFADANRVANQFLGLLRPEQRGWENDALRV